VDYKGQPRANLQSFICMLFNKYSTTDGVMQLNESFISSIMIMHPMCYDLIHGALKVATASVSLDKLILVNI